MSRDRETGTARSAREDALTGQEDAANRVTDKQAGDDKRSLDIGGEVRVPEISQELKDALAAIPEEYRWVGNLDRLLWRDIVSYAVLNADSLRTIQAEYKTLAHRILIILSALAVLLLGVGVYGLVIQGQIQDERRTSLAVSCAISTAVTSAGVKVLNAVPPDTRFFRNLEKLGYPPHKVRVTAGATAGQAYVRGIAQSINRAVGHKGDHLVGKDGAIDCARLRQVSNVP